MNAGGDFWSRRRDAVAAEQQAGVDAVDAEAAAAVQADLATRPEAEVLAELGLPAPESVSSGADARAFMAKAVPEYLRRRALRTLWRSNPVLACLDGLNDYDTDFSNAATDAPGVATTYRVGKGLQAHVDALLKPRPETAEVEDDLPEAEPAPVAVAAADPEPAETETETDDPDMPRPRRMAFRFEGVTA